MRSRTPFALWALPGCLGTGAAIARAALQHPPEHLRTDLAQPLVVVTDWHGYGGMLFGLLAGCIAAAAIVQAATLWPGSAPAPRLPAILSAAAAALAAGFAWPVLFSSDVYAYAAYGDLTLHGLDPYRPAPFWFHDPYVDAARWQWGGTFPACAYGPAFVALAATCVGLTKAGGLGTTLWLLRLVVALAFLAGTALLYRALEGLHPMRRFAVTSAFALNPVAVWTAAEGHNDALALLAVAAGLVLLREARPSLSALALGSSSLLKAPGLLVGAVLALDMRFPALRRARFGAVLAATAIVSLSVAVSLQWPAVETVKREGRFQPLGSLENLAGLGPALALALAFALAGVGRLRRGAGDGYAWLGLGAWLAIPNPYPWYALWVLPAAAAAIGSPIGNVLWAVTILAVLRYLPDAAGTIACDPRILAGAALSPVLLLLARSPERFDDPKGNLCA